MSDVELQSLIARVHDHLNGGALDDQDRQRLVGLLGDIQQAVASPAPSAGGAGPGPGAAGPVLPRLEQLAVDFEAGHPHLAGSLRQIIETLGQGGI